MNGDVIMNVVISCARTRALPCFSKTSRRAFALCTAALLGLAASADAVDWTQYEQSFNIRFPGYTESEVLTDFPVLIRLSPELNSFKYSKCKVSNGGDVRFSDTEGNLLSSEVDTWIENGTSLVWVKIPSFDSDTIITVHYGCSNPAEVNPKDVWSNGYLGVWHLGETGRTFADSTQTGVSFTLDSKYTDFVGRGVSGSVGNAVEFDLVTEGDDAHKGRLIAKDGTNNRYSNTMTLTVEAWLKQRSNTSSYVVYHKNKGRAYAWQAASGNQQIVTVWGTTNETEMASKDVKPSFAEIFGEWYHVAAVYDNVSAHKAVSYVNGVSKSSLNLTEGYKLFADNGDLYIGNSGSSQAFSGSIDEVRVSSVARSAAWVKASSATVQDEEFAVCDMPNDWAKYSHKFTISFPGAPATPLTDFPVLVRISPETIPWFSYSNLVKENGEDLRFTDASGNVLDCEIDTWDENGTSLIWVKVPSLSSRTKITAYYGWKHAPAVDPKAVWSNGYLGVWHMNEAARPVLDSTANGINFTRSYGYSPSNKYDPCVRFAESGGVVGKSVGFDPTVEGMLNNGGLLATDTEGQLCGRPAMTIEIWAKTEAFESTSRYMIGKRMGNTVDGRKVRAYEFEYTSKTPKATFYLENGANNDNDKCALTPSAMSADLAGQWNYHCVCYDSSVTSHTNYLNGAVAATANNSTGFPIHDIPDHLCLGNDCQPSSTKVFNGSLDELRFSNVARSADWVKATYDTIKGESFAMYSDARANVCGFILIFR